MGGRLRPAATLTVADAGAPSPFEGARSARFRFIKGAHEWYGRKLLGGAGLPSDVTEIALHGGSSRSAVVAFFDGVEQQLRNYTIKSRFNGVAPRNWTEAIERTYPGNPFTKAVDPAQDAIRTDALNNPGWFDDIPFPEPYD